MIHESHTVLYIIYFISVSIRSFSDVQDNDFQFDTHERSLNELICYCVIHNEMKSSGSIFQMGSDT